jgi:dihydroorotase
VTERWTVSPQIMPRMPLSDKTNDLLASANGVVGLETAFAAAVTNLLNSRAISLLRLVECLSTRPAEILGLRTKERLKAGADADVVLARSAPTMDSILQ